LSRSISTRTTPPGSWRKNFRHEFDDPLGQEPHVNTDLLYRPPHLLQDLQRPSTVTACATKVAGRAELGPSALGLRLGMHRLIGTHCIVGLEERRGESLAAHLEADSERSAVHRGRRALRCDLGEQV
jgi:hypothetical protein